MAARLITGFTLAPLVVWLLLGGPQWAIIAVLSVAAALCAAELLGMWAEIRSIDRALGVIATVAIAAAPALPGVPLLLITSLAAVALLCWPLVGTDDLQVAARRGALLVLATGYVGALAACMTAIAIRPGLAAAVGDQPIFGPFPFGPTALLTLFVIVFMGDTGAYFAGRFFGRHKLYPLISPKKTIEGSVGGLIASIGGGALCSVLVLPRIGVIDAMILAACCGVVAQIGDLAESLFKRASGTKDSGALLPGHGGMLDRLDGALFAAPIFHAWLVLEIAPGRWLLP